MVYIQHKNESHDSEILMTLLFFIIIITLLSVRHFREVRNLKQNYFIILQVNVICVPSLYA